MAIPRSKGKTTAASKAAAPDPATVAQGINLGTLPGAPQPPVPQALDLKIAPGKAGGLKLTPPVAAAPAPVDLSPVFSRLDDMASSFTAAFAELKALNEALSEQVANLQETLESLTADDEGEEEAPETPQAVAAAQPPKGSKKPPAPAAQASWDDIPVQDQLVACARTQLAGYEVAVAAQSLSGAVAEQGAQVTPERMEEFLRAAGLVNEAGLIQ